VPEEDRKPFFLEPKKHSQCNIQEVNTISEDKIYKMIEENKYRGVVYKALIDQSISNFMLSNCKALFNNGLFRFRVKARNQALVTPFETPLVP
jgi:hypothetical protein